jgi:hypothetical protein
MMENFVQEIMRAFLWSMHGKGSPTLLTQIPCSGAGCDLQLPEAVRRRHEREISNAGR